MDWLYQPDTDKCVLVEIDYHDGEGQGTLYFASRPFISSDTDSPANMPYDDLIIEVPEISATIDRGFSVGEVVIKNHEDMFDRWLNNAYQGWSIRMYIGRSIDAKADFIRVVDGICDGIRFPSIDTISFTFQDESEILDREVQENLMPDGSLQPIAIGQCFNVTAKLEDANTLRYRVNDADCTISEVRDNGVSVSFTNQGDGTFTLAASPAGAITADVVGYTDGTTGEIVKFIASRVGVANFDTFSFSIYPLLKLGVYIPDGGSARNWISDVLTSTGGYWYFNRLGRLSIGQLDVPVGNVKYTIVEDDIIQNGIRITSVTAPLQKVRLSFAKNYTVQSADSLAGSLNTQERWLYSRESREVVVNSFVANQYPNAKSSELIDTYIVSETEVTEEVYRRGVLLTNKAGNMAVETVLPCTSFELGDVVNVIYSKWGFQSGQLCRVVGFREFPLSNTVEIELWFTRGDCLCPTSKVVRDGATELARYRAISKNYRASFDVGPVFRNDLSQGLSARLWLVYITPSGDVTLAYQLFGNWQIDTVLFSRAATASLVTNLNLTWDQVGRPFVSWEEDGEVFIWWYDPVAAATVVTKVADGRTPVCCLDERRVEYGGDSDIVLFFINTDGAIEYRLQRDRFLDSYPTPVTEGGEAMGLEVLNRTKGRRLRLTFWDANEPLGRLRSLYTQPYPVDTSVDAALVESSLVNLVFRDINVLYDAEDGSMSVSSQLESVELRDLLIEKTVEENSLDLSSSLLSVTLEDTLVTYTSEEESMGLESSLISTELREALVAKTVEEDSAEISSSLIAAAMFVP